MIPWIVAIGYVAGVCFIIWGGHNFTEATKNPPTPTKQAKK